MKFKGNLIITDPCYITVDDDYEKTNYGSELDKLGFTTYLVADTGFGDWVNGIIRDDCVLMGSFCADSGQVCVVLEEEAIKYNESKTLIPHAEHGVNASEHCYAIIPDFDGEVEIDTSNPNWTVIHGRGNFNFDSQSLNEGYNEDEE